jgi:hypothetical protein
LDEAKKLGGKIPAILTAEVIKTFFKHLINGDHNNIALEVWEGVKHFLN